MAHLGNTVVNGALRVIGGENVDTINGVTVGSSPKFTDTRKSFYGTCSSSADTAAKVVTLSDTVGWELRIGVIVGVKFTNNNSASSCTLNVNGSGAKSIWYSTGVYTGTSAWICGNAGVTTYYQYDGTYWVWLNHGVVIPGNDSVRQIPTTTSANYEVLFSSTADNTDRTEASRKNNNLLFNPSTGNLQATQLNGVTLGSSPKFTDTTYTFAGGTNKFTVTPSGGSAQDVTITPSIANNVTGSGTNNYLTKFSGANTITNGPAIGSAVSSQTQSTKFLREDGTWAAPSYTTNTDTKVTQTNSATSNAAHRLLLSANANDTTETNTSLKSANFTANPSTGVLTAKEYAGTYQNLTKTGTGTAATTSGSNYIPAKWSLNLGITVAEGDIITFTVPVAGHSYGVFLSVNNGTNYYPIVTNGTSRLTTHYGVGTSISVVFDADGSCADIFPLAGATARTTVTGGVWRIVNFYDSGNSNTYDRNLYNATIKCGSTAIVAGNIIVGKDGVFNHLKDGTAFDITYPILYASGAIAAGATAANGYDVIPFATATTQSGTWTAYKPVYIKGQLSGNTFTPVSTTPLTQTVPTTADGYEYILLGVAYSTTNVYLQERHPIYAYRNGKFGEIVNDADTVNGLTVQTAVPSGALFTDHTYNFSGTTFYSGNTSNSEHAANNMIYNGHYYYNSQGPDAQYLPVSTADGAMYVQAYSTGWVGQIAQDYRNGNLFVRGKNNNAWQYWQMVVSGDQYFGLIFTANKFQFNVPKRQIQAVKSTAAWDSQVYSYDGYVTSCYVTFKPAQTNMAIMIGLDSNPAQDANYTNIDYCWYVQNSGNVAIYESGINTGSQGTYAVGDEFRIEYSNGNVKYYHNGVCCRTVARAISGKLYVDSSFHGQTGVIYDFDFGPMGYDAVTVNGLTFTLVT